MNELSREEFDRLKNEAETQMKELYGGHNMPPYPRFVTLPEKTQAETEPNKPEKPQAVKPPSRPAQNKIGGNLFRFLNLEELTKSPDALLILGLIFLLISDNADEKLILALVFIML